MPRVSTAESIDPAQEPLSAIGPEEKAVLRQLPDSPRIRRLADQLEVIMHTEGFLHFSTTDLAKRLRCSKATLYRIADTREGIYEFAINRWLARVRDTGWQRAGEVTDWSEKLAGYCDAAVDRITESRTSFAFWRDVRNFPDGFRVLMTHQRDRISGMAQIISKGIKAGTFRKVHPQLVSELMELCVRNLVDPEFIATVNLSVGEAVKEWYRIVEYGITQQRDQKPRWEKSR